ncbi:hypothetical protein BV25DRAFT_1919409 [Artomyces pyxidatus]|uniref:Uncharacterized protein n=1 Tax=Artomyces pyxidatus TaxID=48021 RepID=A0ACB8SRK1_9AGAM|nr:hypothetical protein BV25DRAFT_1919409 [Artomyces pyxidatus]
MPTPSLFFSGLLALSAGLPSLAAPSYGSTDPCAKIGGQTFVAPADAIACQKSFPLNETIKANVLNNIARVFDFFTFEDYYLHSPYPFQESTTNIRRDIARINATKYATDYDLNKDIYDFTTELNDGHTRWFPDCYNSYQNLLPTPVVILGNEVVVAPDAVEFLSLMPPEFAQYYANIGFNWQRLAGARILRIDGLPAFSYVDKIASTVSGNYLDHGVRVNSVVSSYRISGTSFSQRFGDLAGPSFLTQTHLTFELIPVNSTRPETVNVPYLANFVGNPFTDGPSYWANNCAAKNTTNGVDHRSASHTKRDGKPLRPMAKIIDLAPKTAVGLPGPFLPTLSPVNGSEGVIKSFILPDNKTGVMFVGSFEPDDYVGFQTDTVAAISQFQAANVTHLIIDLTNNGGGYVCLGLFLHQYLAGMGIGYAGFQSTNRANPLAKKILASDIAQGLNDQVSYYTADDFAFLNNTEMPASYNYFEPSSSEFVNGKSDPTSQRFYDVCTPYNVPVPDGPAFDLKNVAIVGNGNCASTCALFSTLMYERHGTKMAMFGGKPGEHVEFKGMAGNQVLEWADLDSEIKTAGLKDDPLAPPDLLVSSNMRVNWRTAWSWLDETKPIAFKSELPQYHFPYTIDTYNNPQNLWTFAAKELFGAGHGYGY